MVSILPSERTPFDVLGRDIGRSLQSVLPGAVEQGMNRQRGLNAIDQLQQDLAQSGGDITKMLPALARAYTLNPNLERSGIGQLAVQQAQRSTATNPVTGAIGGQQGQPAQQPGMSGLAGGAAQQAAQPQPAQGMAQPKGQGLFLSNFIPQDIGQLISPEQSTNMLADVASKGGDVALTRQLINDYNQGKIGVNELANSNVEKQAANVQRMLGFEEQMKKKINDYIPAETSEAEKNIYYNMLRPALEGSTTFSDAWQKVAADIDNFRKMNEAYVKNIPEPQISGMSDEAERRMRGSAKPIMEVDPLAYNTLEQAYMQKGHSPITPAQILKPLPQDVKKTLSKAEDFRHLIFPQYSTSELTPGRMERDIEMANRGQQQQIPELANSLRNQWNPDLSLLNIYTDLKAKGWTLNNITQLFDDVADQFSPRQKAERNMLNTDLRIPIKYLSE